VRGNPKPIVKPRFSITVIFFTADKSEMSAGRVSRRWIIIGLAGGTKGVGLKKWYGEENQGSALLSGDE
jgi:hypothetical protein